MAGGLSQDPRSDSRGDCRHIILLKLFYIILFVFVDISFSGLGIPSMIFMAQGVRSVGPFGPHRNGLARRVAREAALRKPIDGRS